MGLIYTQLSIPYRFFSPPCCIFFKIIFLPSFRAISSNSHCGRFSSYSFLDSKILLHSLFLLSLFMGGGGEGIDCSITLLLLHPLCFLLPSQRFIEILKIIFLSHVLQNGILCTLRLLESLSILCFQAAYFLLQYFSSFIIVFPCFSGIPDSLPCGYTLWDSLYILLQSAVMFALNYFLVTRCFCYFILKHHSPLISFTYFYCLLCMLPYFLIAVVSHHFAIIGTPISF